MALLYLIIFFGFMIYEKMYIPLVMVILIAAGFVLLAYKDLHKKPKQVALDLELPDPAPPIHIKPKFNKYPITVTNRLKNFVYSKKTSYYGYDKDELIGIGFDVGDEIPLREYSHFKAKVEPYLDDFIVYVNCFEDEWETLGLVKQTYELKFDLMQTNKIEVEVIGGLYKVIGKDGYKETKRPYEFSLLVYTRD